jgi:hypothetical protein
MKTKDIAILTIVLIIIPVFQMFAQQVNFDWVKQIGNTGDDKSYSITLDDSGNVYTTGHFQGTVDFDPGVGVYNLISVGNQNVYISKLDSAGNFLWVKQIGAVNSYSIDLDAQRNIYITGTFQGTADFNPGVGTYNLTSIAFQDIFVSKLNSFGNFVWAKQISGVTSNSSSALTVDALGNVYSTGMFFATTDFDPGIGTYNLISAGSSDIYISKLDSSGNFIWAKQIGGTLQDYAKSVALDTIGNLYITGDFEGIVDFDPGAAIYNFTAAQVDVFISKLDASGNFVWAKQIGGANLDYCNSVIVAPSGNIYCTGQFSGTADFNPGVGTYNLSGNSDIFILKLNVAGNFVWAKAMIGVMGGTDDIGISIALDTIENVYTTGRFNSLTVDFDPGVGNYNFTNAGSPEYDSYISKLDSLGNFVWAKQIGGGLDGGGDDWSTSLTLDDFGNVYTTGYFWDTTDFNTDAGIYYLYAAGFSDIFIHKMNVCKIDTSIQQNGLVLSSNTNGAVYQWIDCANGNTPIAGAINKNYTVLANGNYAVIVTMGNCIDTSGCRNITNVGIASALSLKTISVFPNPTNGEIKVDLNYKISNATFRLVNVMGQTIFEKANISGSHFSFDISEQANGIYFLEVNEIENVSRTKLIKY